MMKANTELGAFLRLRRERTHPEILGLPTGGRRRTPGLRRDEVAMLAGISATWYTFLEQGRSVRASVGTLGRIANVLRLSSDERRHLGTLAGASVAEAVEVVPPPKGIQDVLEALEPSPSFVLAPSFEMVACNESAQRLWNYDLAPGRDRNILWRLFTDPKQRTPQEDWRMMTRVFVARLRPIFARHSEDETMRTLVEDLSARSPEFRELWARHEILTGEDVDFVYRFKGVRGRLTCFAVCAPGDYTMCVLVKA
jgi:transcriptional regulator with XRE-family HTH domain